MTERPELGDDAARASQTAEGSPPAVSRRVRLAQGLAFVALVCALVGALGPAEPLRTTYTWPPPTLPKATPSALWYTPLLVSRHRPESITATIPCSLPRALDSSANPVTVLATARFPAQADGLAVARVGDQLVVRVGDQVVNRAELLAGTAGDSKCAYRLQMRSGRWSIDGGPDNVARAGRLKTMPTVNGVFSGLDLGSGVAPSIEVTTEVHSSRTTIRQALAWTLAILGIVSALLLVAVERRPRPLATVRRLVRKGIRHAHPADVVVAIVLLGWWVISPAFWDDGFIIARERMFSASRGFSQYYAALGTNLPIGYWLEWTQHWLTQSFTSLLVLRVPSLICLVGVWILCRWMLPRVLGPSRSESNVARWALASTFLVGALAWGMTVRPEPVMALLITAVMACIVRFLQRETVAPLATVTILVPLALTGHHTGVVAMAPLFAITPSLFRWVRPRVPVAATLVTASIGLLLVLAFVGSDLEQRRSDAQLAWAYGLGAGWREEAVRYFLLSDFPYGTTLRRASVALIALAVVAFVLRRRRRDAHEPLDFPGVTLAVALLLLVLTPSKWPWHFGALLGIASLAVAAEAARIRGEAARSHGRSAWPLLAVGAGCVAAAWSWWPRTGWNAVDLRTMNWTPGFESWFPVSALSIALPLLLLGGALLTKLVGDRRRDADEIPWRVAPWTALIIAAPAIVFTVGVLVADTLKTDSWTLARQNIETVWGDAGCGLAEDLLVPVMRSIEPLSATASSAFGPEPAWLSPAPVRGLPRFVLSPVPGGSSRSAWFELPARRRVGLFVAGIPDSSDRLGLEWGHLQRGQVDSLGDEEISVNFTSDVGAGTVPWRFLAASELPLPIPDATVARVTLRTNDFPVNSIAVTSLVAYTNEPLANQLCRDSEPSLVLPNLLTYFPCIQEPLLRNGVVQVPRHIVTARDFGSTWPLRYRGTSPFDGVIDLYRLDRLPVSDSKDAPGDVVVFGVDRRIPGAKQLPAVARTFTS
jgi:hypothetical protein